MIFFLIIVHGYMQINADDIREVYIYLALLMWAKLLYFLRIFKQTGYLIRMLLNVIADFKIFLVVLLITICGFANSFWILSKGSDNHEDFIGGHVQQSFNYIYTMNLGDFDT